MANLKNITELPVAESVEGLNFIVNDNGSAKQIAASAVGAQADWNVTDETSPAFIANKPTISAAQVQADWNQNDETANDYIKNRPFYTIPNWMPVGEKQTIQFTYNDTLGVWTGSRDSVTVPFFDAYEEYADHAVCKLVVNGVEYVGTFNWTDSLNGYFGNPTLICKHPHMTGYTTNLSDTGEDFVMVRCCASDEGIVLKNAAPSCEVSMYISLESECVKIPSEYLPSREPYVIDSEAYTYGDDALTAILEGRQILIKVPNKSDSTLYSNFMPVLQYQLPNENNNYLTLFYLNDGIAENIMTAMQTGSFDGVYGSIEMTLSTTYTECPLKVDPVK